MNHAHRIRPPEALAKRLEIWARRRLCQNRNSYCWDFDSGELESSLRIVPSGDTRYDRAVDLKQKLAAAWRAAAPGSARRKKLVIWYVRKWGRIRRIGDQKLIAFSEERYRTLVTRGVVNIASWSKALALRNPNEYPILDARVAAALSVMQAHTRKDEPRFPLLKTQNKLIESYANCVRQHPPQTYLDKRLAYPTYRLLLKQVANRLDVRIYEIEMLLFAMAPKMAQKAIERKQERSHGVRPVATPNRRRARSR